MSVSSDVHEASNSKGKQLRKCFIAFVILSVIPYRESVLNLLKHLLQLYYAYVLHLPMGYHYLLRQPHRSYYYQQGLKHEYLSYAPPHKVLNKSLFS